MKTELTERQEQVLKLLIEGRRQDEIAKMLGLTRSAVRNRLEQVRNKLCAETTLEAAVIYTRRLLHSQHG